ncbi:hypothetical protein INT48_005543, partial [Thamnidium elegans]
NNNLSDWTISCFKQHQLNNARIKPNMNVIIKYKQRVVDISGAVKDEDVKQYIASLLEDVGNKSTEEQSGLILNNCSNVNIASVNYETQVMSADHSSKIGSESARKYYPKDLIDKTEMIIKEIPDSFVEDQDFYNRIFDTITLADEQSSNELLAEVYFSVFKSNRPFRKFFHVVVQSFVSGLVIEDSDVYKLETNYNYRIL